MFGRVNAPATSIVLKRLKPRTTYDLSVVPIYDFGQGKSRKAEGTTGMYHKLEQDLISFVLKINNHDTQEKYGGVCQDHELIGKLKKMLEVEKKV